MKKLLLFSLIYLLSGQSVVLGQNTCIGTSTSDTTCIVDLNVWSGLVPISGTLYENFRPYGCYWLCNGDSLFLKGASDMRVYAESGSYIFLDTNSLSSTTSYSGAVWLKDGAIMDSYSDPALYNGWVGHVMLESSTSVVHPNVIAAPAYRQCTDIVFIYPAVFPSGCDTTHTTSIDGTKAVANSISIISVLSEKSIKVFISTQDLKFDSELRIFNLQGQEVLMQAIQNSESSIAIPYLKQGVYVVRVKSGNQVVSKKIVVL